MCIHIEHMQNFNKEYNIEGGGSFFKDTMICINCKFDPLLTLIVLIS